MLLYVLFKCLEFMIMYGANYLQNKYNIRKLSKDIIKITMWKK